MLTKDQEAFKGMEGKNAPMKLRNNFDNRAAFTVFEEEYKTSTNHL